MVRHASAESVLVWTGLMVAAIAECALGIAAEDLEAYLVEVRTGDAYRSRRHLAELTEAVLALHTTAARLMHLGN